MTKKTKKITETNKVQQLDILVVKVDKLIQAKNGFVPISFSAIV